MSPIITADQNLWLPEETSIALAARQATTRREFLARAGAGAAAVAVPCVASAADPTDIPVVITINDPDYAVRDTYGTRTNMATGQLIAAAGIYAVTWSAATIAQIADKLVLFFRSMKNFFVDFHKWANPNGDFNAWFSPMNTRFTAPTLTKFLTDKGRQLNESRRAYIARMGAYVFSFFVSAYLSVYLEGVVKNRIAPLMSRRFGSCSAFFNTAMGSYAAASILAAFSVWIGNIFANFVGRAASGRRRALLATNAQLFCDNDFFMNRITRYVNGVAEEIINTGHRNSPTGRPAILGGWEVRWDRTNHALTGKRLITDFHLNSKASSWFHGLYRDQVSFYQYSRDAQGNHTMTSHVDQSLAVFKSGRIF